jgi:mannose-6-phosphate isomerase-like protein (cupin superfamily)
MRRHLVSLERLRRSARLQPCQGKPEGLRYVLCVGSVAALFALGPHLGAQGGQGRGRGEGQTVILEQAPTDRSVAIPTEKLAQYLKDMDAKKLQTIRMIEGGKFNVNIRRITNAETALIHPNTTDLWVVLEGSGTLTTGGIVENGKFVGGESHALKAGDVTYLPAGLPHGVSGVSGNITWLNVRWDTDWPADSQPGAGNFQGAGRGAGRGARGAAGEASPVEREASAARSGAQRGGPPPGGSEGRGRGGFAAPLEYGGSGEIFIPKERLDGYMKDMELKDVSTLRMIEGGRYNVNIRRIKAPSTEYHDVTVDTWVILKGAGTANTGYERTPEGGRVEGTGVSAPAKVGDVFFIPAHFPHGFSAVTSDVYWLNIRWDVNYPNFPATK